MSDPLDRLGRELTVAIDDQVRAEHLAALANALSIHVVDDVTAARAASPRTWARRLAGAAALATLMAVPPAALAQNALPGDALHGIKLALEHVQQLVNPDIRAVHRLEELAVLLDDASSDVLTVQHALGNAIAATSASQASDQARARLAELTERAEARNAADKPGVGPEAGADDDGDADGPGKSGEPHGKAHQQRGEADDAADAPTSEPTDDASDASSTPEDEGSEPHAPKGSDRSGTPGHSGRPTSQNPRGHGEQPSSSGGATDPAGS